MIPDFSEKVCPISAHAAFDKAADILGIGIRHVRVDPETQKVDIAAMKRAICGRTCVLVGSAPQFAHGSMDNVEEIAKYAWDLVTSNALDHGS